MGGGSSLPFCLEASGWSPSGAQSVPGRESSREGPAGDPRPPPPTSKPLSRFYFLHRQKNPPCMVPSIGLLWNTTLDIFVFDQEYLMKIHSVKACDIKLCGCNVRAQHEAFDCQDIPCKDNRLQKAQHQL